MKSVISPSLCGLALFLLTSAAYSAETIRYATPMAMTSQAAAADTCGGEPTEFITRKCSSTDYRYRDCPTGLEKVARVEVARKHSSSSCREGSSFGIKNDNILWVSNGCRATFRLYVANKIKENTPDPVCASNVFHPITKRCLATEVTSQANKFFFNVAGVCIPTLLGAETHCTPMPAWDGCDESAIPQINYKFPSRSSNITQHDFSQNPIVPLIDNGQCERLGEESFQRSCSNYFGCYNSAINSAIGKVEGLAAARAVAGPTDVQQLNDYYATARECYQNFLASLDSQDLSSEELAGTESATTPEDNSLNTAFNDFDQYEAQFPGSGSGGDDGIAGKDGPPGLSGRSASAGGGNFATGFAGGLNSGSGGVQPGRVNFAGKPPVDESSLARTSGGSGKAGSAASRSKTGLGNFIGKSSSGGPSEIDFSKKKGDSADGKNNLNSKHAFGSGVNDRSTAANMEKPILFKMVSRQYQRNEQTLRSLDSYLRGMN